MTDAQFTILCSVIAALGTGLGTLIKWAVGRIVTALDGNTAAMLAHVQAAAVLSTKIDGVAEWVERHTPIDGSRAYEDPPRTRTPPRGVTAGEYSQHSKPTGTGSR